MRLLFMLFLLTVSAFAETYQDIYSTNPDITSCNAGVLTAAEKKKVLDLVNQIRALHKLPAVTYNEGGNNDAMQASLICAATKNLDHYPPTSATCYTAAGANGAKTSNLHLGYSFGGGSNLSPSSEQIIGWLIDDKDAAIEKRVGHRRAIINPSLKSIAFGRVDGVVDNATWSAGALKYQDYVSGSIPSTVDYVAYPQGDYPTTFFSKSFYLSFHAFYNKSNVLLNSNVDYSQAQISVKAGNTNLTVSGITYDNVGWGSVPNSLQWYVSGLKDNVEYTVNITNAMINGVSKDYTYTFKLVTGMPGGPVATTQATPADNTTGIDNGSKLTWNSSSNATSYNLQISKSIQFTSNTLDTNLTATEYSLKGLEASTKYYWRIASKNNSGVSNWSSAWSFTTKAGAPSIVTLTSPLDQEVLDNTDAKLQWQADASATTYNLQLANSKIFDAFSIKFDIKDIKTNSYLFDNNKLTPETKYFWRVQGVNTVGAGSWSKTQEFNTGKINSVDLKELAGFDIKVYSDNINFINLSSQAKYFTFRIYDLLGNQVMSNNVILESSLSIKTNELGNGAYYIYVQSDKYDFVKQFQIVK